MILDDEILKDGDVVKLVAVISGGSMDDNSIFDIRTSSIEYPIIEERVSFMKCKKCGVKGLGQHAPA